MLSFIVIGRNEGWKLSNCLKSIYRAANSSGLKDFEVIYVDSNSTDDSVARAKEFERVAVYRITGKCNAAVARNIGARESLGSVLFFIDGDMEIDEKFLSHALQGGLLKYPCLTGHLLHIAYNGRGERLGERREPPESGALKEDLIRTGCGIFMIERAAWEVAGGMRSQYKRSQDIDLTVRLERLKIKTIRLPFLIAKHHTVEYNNQDRIWSTFRQNYYSYPAMLFRDHILLPYSWIRAFRQNYTAFLLILVVLLMAIEWVPFYAAIIYFLSVLARVIKVSSKSVLGDGCRAWLLSERVIFQIAQDFVFWAAFLFFFPSKVEERYERV